MNGRKIPNAPTTAVYLHAIRKDVQTCTCADLRQMRALDLLEQKGKSRSSYYKPGPFFEDPVMLVGQPEMTATGLTGNPELLRADLPQNLKELVEAVGKRSSRELIATAIVELCKWKALTIRQIAGLMNRNDKYLTTYVTALRDEGKITYTIPEMPNHPDQAYKTAEQSAPNTKSNS